MKHLILALSLVALAACGSLPGSSGTGGTAGAPATAGQAAQTIGGSQGQAPGTATSGTASVYNNFASSIPGEFLTAILKQAADKNWTPEQIESVLKSANGAPQTVTISGGTFSVNSGNASSIPSTAGGGGGVGQSGAGTITRP